MKISEGAKAFVGDVVFGIAAAFIGSKMAEKDEKKENGGDAKPKKPGEVIGDRLGRRLKDMQFDRGMFLHELHTINVATNGGIQAIIDLYDELERKNFITVGGKHYSENWVGRRLMDIEQKYRSTEYVLLNDVLLDKGREAFFAQLEILHDNKFQQEAQKFLAVAKDKFQELDSDATRKLRGLRVTLQKSALENRMEKGYKL